MDDDIKTFAKLGLKGILDKNKDQDFDERMLEEISLITKLFKDKNRQYSNGDPLINFRKGALMNCGTAGYPEMYLEARNYVTKHVSHIWNHGIEGEKIDESLRDIVLYSLIMLYMYKKWTEEM